MKSNPGLGFLLAICANSIAGSAPVNAQELARLSERSSRNFIRCVSEAGITGREQNRCSFAEMNRQSHLAQRAYVSARNRAGVTGRRSLAASQRAWKRAIDRKCHTRELFSPAPLGTIEIDDYLICLSMENIKRMEWLERQYRRPKPRPRPGPGSRTSAG